MRDKWRVVLERAMDSRVLARRAGEGRQPRIGRRAAPSGESHEMDAPLEIDLVHGLAVAEARLDTERPASLSVRLDGRLVGTLPALAGAEPLRGVHLRPLLLKYMLPGYLRAAAAAGQMPDVLAHSVGRRPPAGAMPDGQPTDRAA